MLNKNLPQNVVDYIRDRQEALNRVFGGRANKVEIVSFREGLSSNNTRSIIGDDGKVYYIKQ